MHPFHITLDQIEEFKTKGFIRLKNAIPPSLLAKLQTAVSELNDKALASHGKENMLPSTSYVEESNSLLLTRANDLIQFIPDTVLDLLACPAMMAIARDVSGADTIPIQCDALFKHKHPYSAIHWHQDALHPRTYPYLNIGIYLDDADSDDGCLVYVKGSQHEKQEICELTRKYFWDLPESEKVPVKAGDILIQDMMVLHGSPKKQQATVRRTIYVEMRPAIAEIEQGVHSERWIEVRKRWMGIVARRAEANGLTVLKDLIPKDLKSDQEEIAQLLSIRESPIPANYCSEGIEMPD